MALFPLFLKLQGRSCLVVGGGRIAESKIRSLLSARACVRVVAPEAQHNVVEWGRAGLLEWTRRRFEARDLEGVFLVIAATGFEDVNAVVFRLARERDILCNAVDDPAHCDFFFPAVVRRGDLQVAVSTAGRSPALAQRLRRELQSQFSPQYAGWIRHLGATRDGLFRSDIPAEQRRRRLHELASAKNFESWRSQTRAQGEPVHET